MAFYEDAEQAGDKLLVKQYKDDFITILARANDYIDKIVTDRYGDMSKYVGHINLLKTNLNTLKAKYNLPAVDTEIDGYTTQMDAQIATVQARWDTEVYNKLNP